MNREIKKVLVIKLGALGDFVLALAAMKRIRLAHPRARITLLTIPPFEALAKSSPYFNEVEADGRPSGLSDWLALCRRLRKARYDRVYDLETSNLTSSYFQMLRPFPPQWSGTAIGSMLRHRNRYRDGMHTLERHAEQLQAAGIWPDAPTQPGSAPPPDLSWILRRNPEPRPVAGAAKPRPFVLFVPGGSEQRLDKRWPIDRFALLGRLLRERGFDIVVIGGPQESALARQIQKTVGQTRDLTGRTDFAQIALLGAKAALAVGNETGPMHLIAAAGAPSIVLCSGAENDLDAPRGNVIIMRAASLADMPVDQVNRTVLNLAPAT